MATSRPASAGRSGGTGSRRERGARRPPSGARRRRGGPSAAGAGRLGGRRRGRSWRAVRVVSDVMRPTVSALAACAALCERLPACRRCSVTAGCERHGLPARAARTVNVGGAGAGVEGDRAAVGGRRSPATRARPRPAPPRVAAGAGGVAAGEPLEGVLGQLRREARAVVVDREAARAVGATTVTVVPAGVCLRALVSRLVTTWCSRCTSPVTSIDSSGRSSCQRWSGATTRASETASTSSRDRSTASRARAAGRSRAGPAAAGPRPSRSSGPTPPRPCRARSASCAGSSGRRRASSA